MSSNSKAPRQVVVVDVETNGLDHEKHTVVEVAWENLTTGAAGVFVPPHDVHHVLATADVKALQITRYIDRLATAEQDDDRGEGARVLWENLRGNTLAGSNPRFDAAFLTKMFTEQYVGTHDMKGVPPWHHRLLDLSAYTAGVLGIDLGELPGLFTVCAALAIPLVDAHTAGGDVAATVACFRRLAEMRANLTMPGRRDGINLDEVFERVESRITSDPMDTVMLPERVAAALALIVQFGSTDGAHHKDWVLDQVTRTLAADRYPELVRRACDGEDGENTYSWEEGIAP